MKWEPVTFAGQHLPKEACGTGEAALAAGREADGAPVISSHGAARKHNWMTGSGCIAHVCPQKDKHKCPLVHSSSIECSFVH